MAATGNMLTFSHFSAILRLVYSLFEQRFIVVFVTV